MPSISGKVIVRSVVGSSSEITNSKSLTVTPSMTIGESPASVPVEVACTPVKFEPSPNNESAVIVPEVSKSSFPKEISPLESVIEPSPRIRLPIVDPVAIAATPVERVPVVNNTSLPNDIESEEDASPPFVIVILPTTDPDASVAIPAVSVPSVSKSSFPNEIEPLSSVMEAFDSVKSPIFVPASKFAIPLDVKSPTSRAPSVFRFSSPKEIFPPDDVMDPSANVKFPIVDPVAIAATPVIIFPSVFRLLSPKETVPLLSVISFPSKISVPIVASEPEEFKGTSILVNFPVDGEFAPIETPSIEPPVKLIDAESCIARLPKPKEDLAKESLSTVQSAPFETIKFPSLCCKSAIVIRLESASCFVST